jgi:hypothetical protein
MEPMITHDAAAVYHGTKALSNSSMGKLLKCPALFQQALSEMDGQEHQQTPAMLLGSVFHSLVLEPDKTPTEYACKQNSGTTKAGKEEAAAAKERGITLVTPDVWSTAVAMAASACAHPLIVAAKRSEAWETETSLYWEEREHIPCKARIDAMAEIPGAPGLCVIDLKSTTDASPDAISRHIVDYGYHRQAAWYMHALSKCGRTASTFIFLFVEKQPPYLCTAITIAESAIKLACDDIRQALDTYEQCESSGVWPGYTTDLVTEIDLPDYIYRRAS